ncbi:hypothetical protein BJ742DRAFT_839036 [Cladochytrium replicatum]|nr:hypothetical protein BJ742DRAFT_839036 [Cladochytrium replicatum]
MGTNKPTARVSLLGAIPNDAGVSLLDVANFLDFAETGTGDIALKGTIQRSNNTLESHAQQNLPNAGYYHQGKPGDEMFRRNGPDGQLMLNPDTLFVTGVGELTLGTGTLERRIKTQDRSTANASPSRSEKSTSSTSSSANQQVYNKGQVWQRPSPSSISQPVETLPVFSRKQSIEASSKEQYLLQRNAKAEQPPPLPTTTHGAHRQSSQSQGFMSPQTAPYGIGTSPQYGQTTPMSLGGKERIRSVQDYNHSPINNHSIPAMPFQGSYQPSLRDSTPSASPRTSTVSAGMSPYLFSLTPSQGSPAMRHSNNYQQSPAYFSPGTEVQWTGTHAPSPRMSQSNVGAVATPPQTPSFRAMSVDPLSQPSTPTTPKYSEAQVTSAFQHQQLQQQLQQQAYDPYSTTVNPPTPPQMKTQIPPSRRSESAAHSPYTTNAPMPFPNQNSPNTGLMNKIFTKTAGVVGGVVNSGRRKSNAASSLAHFNPDNNNPGSAFSRASSKNADRQDKFEELLKKKDAETVKLSLTPSFLGAPGGSATVSATGNVVGGYGDEPEQSQLQQQRGGWKQQPLQQDDHSTSSSFGAKLTRSLSSKSLKSYSRKGRSD